MVALPTVLGNLLEVLRISTVVDIPDTTLSDYLLEVLRISTVVDLFAVVFTIAFWKY